MAGANQERPAGSVQPFSASLIVIPATAISTGSQSLGSTVTGVMRAMRELVQRRAAQGIAEVEAVDSALRAGGWVPLTRMDRSLPLVTIALRGSQVCGVAMCAGHQWTEARQRQILAVAQRDALHGVLFVGEPAPGDRALPGAEFIEAPGRAMLQAHARAAVADEANVADDAVEGGDLSGAWTRMRQA